MLYCCIFFTLEYTVAFQPFFFLIAIKLAQLQISVAYFCSIGLYFLV